MRCYYDQQIFMSQANGGISRYFFELIGRFGAGGEFQPTVFAGWYVSQLPLRTLKGSRVIGLRRPGFPIGPVWHWAVRASGALNPRLLRTLAPRIYHPTYYNAAARPAGTRQVVTVYDMIHEKFPGNYPADDPTAEQKRRACREADAVICISESTRQDLLERYPELEGRTSVVHLAASEHFRAAVEAPLDAVDGSPYALFVGLRAGYKGFDVVLDAWQQLGSTAPELRLICAGGGGFLPAELDAIRRRGLEKKVSQVSAGDRKLVELYQKAALLVYPSRYEGFGLPVLEAMACDCPVVCCRSSSLPEVGGEAAVYFEPGDASGLAAGVARVVGDAGYREGIIHAGREQRAKFSWDRCAEQTAAVYRACVSAA